MMLRTHPNVIGCNDRVQRCSTAETPFLQQLEFVISKGIAQKYYSNL